MENPLAQFKDAIERTNIISKTDPQGIITFVNDEFCKISGYTKEELVGKNHNIVRHPDVDSEVFRKLWETISSGGIYKATVKNRAKDGSTFYVNTTIIPISDEKGDIIEYIAIRYDVTKEMEYKESLEKTKRQLQELNQTLEEKIAQKTHELKQFNETLRRRVAEEVAKNEQKQRVMLWQSRLASMGEMLSNIAHQWRQPLSRLRIVLFSMKESQPYPSETFLEYYEQASKLIETMSQTIEDFTEFFKPNRTKKRFLLGASIEEALAMLRQQIEKASIEVSFTSQEVSVLGVENEMTQVMLNLLKNSLDAFETNGVLLREIHIQVQKEANEGVIVYRDNAGGIQQKDVYKIFEPYYTTKHKSRGTGLGLFISKMICEQGFNGSIDVKTRRGTTTFIIRVPLE